MKGGKAAKKWSKSEDLPLYLLIAAFGIKSTGEIKVGASLFFSVSVFIYPKSSIRLENF